MKLNTYLTPILAVDVNTWVSRLLVFVIVAAIVLTILLMVFMFWTAWFIPIYKKMKYDMDKQSLESEAQKIITRKEEAIKETADVKTAFAEWTIKAEEEKRRYEALKKKNDKIVSNLEAAEKIEAGKKKAEEK